MAIHQYLQASTVPLAHFAVLIALTIQLMEAKPQVAPIFLLSDIF